MELKNNERIDDLQFKNLKIIQKAGSFCFGIDAVLLSDFAKDMKRSNLVVDLCTGTGIIAILTSGKTNAQKIIGVEIQEEIAEMATRSVKMNNLEQRVEIINKDLKELNDVILSGTVDTITVNPPYMKGGGALQNDKDTIAISRHEVCCTLEDVVKESSRMLKTNGSFYMVHKPERLVDIFCTMRKYKIEPKRIRFVHPSKEKVANIVLIEGSKDGKSFLKYEKPLYVYEDGKYTDEIYNIYGMNNQS